MSLFVSFFKVLSLYLEARIRIQICIKVEGRIRIRIKVRGRIRISIKVTSRIQIQICIKMTSRIRIQICIKVKGIRNYASKKIDIRREKINRPGTVCMTSVLSSSVCTVFFMPQSASVSEMSIFMIRSIPFLLNTCTPHTLSILQSAASGILSLSKKSDRSMFSHWKAGSGSALK
jgi:hypothetical protein